MLRERLFISVLVAAGAIAVSVGAPGSPFGAFRAAPRATSEPAAVEATSVPPPTAVAQLQPSAAPAAPKKAAATPRPTAAARRQTPAPLPSGVTSRQQLLTNQARAAAGLPALAWSTCLAGVAANHSTEMADAGFIYHGDGVQRELNCGLGASHSGENVGRTSENAGMGREGDTESDIGAQDERSRSGGPPGARRT